MGCFLRKTGQIDSNFCTASSKLVFNVCLPLLLFTNLINSEINYQSKFSLIQAGILLAFILFLLAEIYAFYKIPDPKNKGVFVQGTFRGNMGLIGLAFVFNAYGEKGLALSAGYVGLITILFNVLSLITLNRSNSKIKITSKINSLIKQIIKNPLIIAVFLALILNYLHIKLPKPLIITSKYLANISLPLAMICIGAAFNWRDLVNTSNLSIKASLIRLIVSPIIAVILGKILFNLSGESLGILFFMAATPTAAASYVMAKSMGANDKMAANIITLTQFGSIFTVSIGATILATINWI